MSESSKVRFYDVPAERAGQRIDNLLVSVLNGVPKTLVYRWLRKGEVRVNGGRCKANHRLQEGDKVRIPPVRQAPKSSGTVSEPERVQSWILEKGGKVWVINKPHGVAVHSGSKIRHGLIDYLRAWQPDQWFELVHRLDRETSGCLWVAKDRKTLLAIQQGLNQRRVHKRYLCLMHGVMPQAHLEVSLPLRKLSFANGEHKVVVDEENGKRAVTVFREIERYRGGWTLAEATIETGRTHQIRVHAAALDLHLGGDQKYADNHTLKDSKRIGLDRLFLHCVAMSFEDEEVGLDLHSEAPLSDDLRQIIDRLQR